MVTNPTSTFIRQMQMIDQKGLTVRDTTALWYIVNNPGRNGQDIAHALGFTNRSSFSSCFRRLIFKGLIEDRRGSIMQAVPSIFHPTQAGIDFWHEVVPQDQEGNHVEDSNR